MKNRDFCSGEKGKKYEWKIYGIMSKNGTSVIYSAFSSSVDLKCFKTSVFQLFEEILLGYLLVWNEFVVWNYEFCGWEI